MKVWSSRDEEEEDGEDDTPDDEEEGEAEPQTRWNVAVPQSFAASDHPVACLASTDH